MDYRLVAVDADTYAILCSTRVIEDDARRLYKRLELPTERQGVLYLEPLQLLREQIRLSSENDKSIPFYVRSFGDGLEPQTYAMLTNTDPSEIDRGEIADLAQKMIEHSFLGRFKK